MTGVVDAHLHVWDLLDGDYPWLGPEHGELYDTFHPSAARSELDTAGVEHAVLVQAEDSENETRRMLDRAAAHTWVAGVVGWVQLDTPVSAARQLERWSDRPPFCGVRHLVHEDPRADFLAMPAVRYSLGLLVQRGLPLDVPDAWPHHLEGVAAMASAVPDLVVVLDHLGKPPTGVADFERWRAVLGEVAARPNTVAKVSGLALPGRPPTVEALRPVWEVALELFGPRRLMYGGDWPMTVSVGGYQPTWRALHTLIAELSTAEQAQVLTETAASIYRLDLSRAASPSSA